MTVIAAFLFLIVILLCASAFSYWGYSSEKGMQIFITRNQEQPHTLNISISMNIWSPPFSSQKDRIVECNMTRFTYYDNLPGLTFSGYSATLPELASNTSYQCFYQDWTGKKLPFPIPLGHIPIVNFHIDIQKDSTIPLHDPLSIQYTTDDNMPVMFIQAIDSSNHFAYANSGFNSTFGTAYFTPFSDRHFVPGSGFIEFFAQEQQPTITEQGWDYVSIIIRSGLILPIYWQ